MFKAYFYCTPWKFLNPEQKTMYTGISFYCKCAFHVKFFPTHKKILLFPSTHISQLLVKWAANKGRFRWLTDTMFLEHTNTSSFYDLVHICDDHDYWQTNHDYRQLNYAYCIFFNLIRQEVHSNDSFCT